MIEDAWDNMWSFFEFNLRVDVNILLTTARRANNSFFFLWKRHDAKIWQGDHNIEPNKIHLRHAVSPVWTTCFDFVNRWAHYGLLGSQHASTVGLIGQQGAQLVQQGCTNNSSAAWGQQCLGARCSRARIAAIVEAATWQFWPDLQRPGLDQRSCIVWSYNTTIDLRQWDQHLAQWPTWSEHGWRRGLHGRLNQPTWDDDC